MALFIFFYPFIEGYLWYLFIERYSFLDAVALAMTGGVLGLLIMLIQGRAALASIQKALASGQSPTNRVMHRGLVMFGGLLIFTPGILSKIVGIFFILPGFRHLVVLFFKGYFASKIANGSFRIFASNGAASFYKAYENPEPLDRDVVEIRPTSIEHTQKAEPSRPKS